MLAALDQRDIPPAVGECVLSAVVVVVVVVVAERYRRLSLRIEMSL